MQFLFLFAVFFAANAFSLSAQSVGKASAEDEVRAVTEGAAPQRQTPTGKSLKMFGHGLRHHTGMDLLMKLGQQQAEEPKSFSSMDILRLFDGFDHQFYHDLEKAQSLFEENAKVVKSLENRVAKLESAMAKPAEHCEPGKVQLVSAHYDTAIVLLALLIVLLLCLSLLFANLMLANFKRKGVVQMPLAMMRGESESL
ncbi:hypothetical protein niasHS_012917 [Heterodera schachtii]|uniref:Uncharacterized protein n=1 Tax=Heterodera schachtii TaxID=97005 RepID=A0ABD2IJG5_HETSC